MSKFSDRKNKSARSKTKKPPVKRILVVTEGEFTEREYINGFADKFKQKLKVEYPSECGIAHITAVNLAKKCKEETEKKAKKFEDDDEKYESVWCVLDVDDHPKMQQAISDARDAEIKLVISNPCFELWLYLHFKENPGALDRKKLQKEIEELDKCYKKNPKHVLYKNYEANYDSAKKRAMKIVKETKNQQTSLTRNPYTDFYLLTEHISQQ